MTHSVWLPGLPLNLADNLKTDLWLHNNTFACEVVSILLLSLSEIAVKSLSNYILLPEVPKERNIGQYSPRNTK